MEKISILRRAWIMTIAQTSINLKMGIRQISMMKWMKTVSSRMTFMAY